MSNFRLINRDMDFLMPPSVGGYAAAPPRAVRCGSDRGTGPAGDDRQLPGLGRGVVHPRLLLLTMLIYGYAIGVFSSRNLERATFNSVAFRFCKYFTAANEHPDHDTHGHIPPPLPRTDRGAVRAGARRDRQKNWGC